MEAVPYIWFGVAVFLAIIEAITYQLVSIWFVAGALVSTVIAVFMPEAILLQIIVFVAVSLVALLITRPFVRKLTNKEKTPTNSDRNIGKSGYVLDDINNELGVGRVNIDGAVWSAKSEDDSVIKKDTRVTVRDIRGVKLIVMPE